MSPWEAEWISDDAPAAPNTWLSFRKTFELGMQPREAITRIACDSKYWLWINGRLVVFEGQLKRGPTPDSSYFDQLDLAEHLRPGENTIAVLVWYFGRQGMSHHDSGQAGLVLQMHADDQLVATDDSWRVRRHPAYGNTEAPHPNWRLPESNIRFDARRNLQGWTLPAYSDEDWPRAKSLGRPPCKPWGPLVLRPIPQWRNSGLKQYESAPATPFTSDGTPISVRLPYNSQITPYLEVDSAAGQVIDMRTDNYRGGGEFNVRGEYVTTSGVQQYESLGWMNGHEVIYTIPAGVRVLDLLYRETGYDTDLSGSFECSDEKLNALWKKAQRTLYLEMRDGYVDCPGRERAQWWGDITLELQQAFYALDRKSDRLTAKAMHELVGWQKPDGALFSPIPAGNWDKELPMQMLAAIGRYGFWQYYRYTGDQRTIEKVYPQACKYLDLWTVGADGLVVERKGGWTWGDWGENKDTTLLYNCWYYLALDGVEQMANLLDDSQRAAECGQKKQSLRDAINQKLWTGTGYRSPGHEGPLDDRGNALAVVAGIADGEKFPSIKRVFSTQFHASPYMEKYVLESLFLMEEPDAAMDRTLKRYDAMIASPLTTLWEGWGVGEQGFGGGSYNHAWSGGPLSLMSQYVAGISPASPGYRSVEISPQLGRLTWVKATVASPRGDISVHFRKDKQGKLSGTLTTPPGVNVTLTVPCKPEQVIEWHAPNPGERVPTHRQRANGSSSAKTLSVQLDPGRNHFSVK